MTAWTLVAFYVGAYFGGLAALWTVARVHRWPLRWWVAALWPIAYAREIDEAGHEEPRS